MNLSSSLFDEDHKDALFVAVVGGTVGSILLLGALVVYLLFVPNDSCQSSFQHLRWWHEDGMQPHGSKQESAVAQLVGRRPSSTPRPARSRGMLAFRRPQRRQNHITSTEGA